MGMWGTRNISKSSVWMCAKYPHPQSSLTVASYGILITQQPKTLIQQPLLVLFTSLVWREIKRQSKELDLKINLLTHKLHFFCCLILKFWSILSEGEKYVWFHLHYVIVQFTLCQAKAKIWGESKSLNWMRHCISPCDFFIKETTFVMVKRSVLPHDAYCIL